MTRRTDAGIKASTSGSTLRLAVAAGAEINHASHLLRTRLRGESRQTTDWVVLDVATGFE